GEDGRYREGDKKQALEKKDTKFFHDTLKTPGALRGITQGIST
ncbi:hypothetical protein MNBD_NITROSPINAE04-1539, partial [hydrothermal vent metagenome]